MHDVKKEKKISISKDVNLPCLQDSEYVLTEQKIDIQYTARTGPWVDRKSVTNRINQFHLASDVKKIVEKPSLKKCDGWRFALKSTPWFM